MPRESSARTFGIARAENPLDSTAHRTSTSVVWAASYHQANCSRVLVYAVSLALLHVLGRHLPKNPGPRTGPRRRWPPNPAPHPCREEWCAAHLPLPNGLPRRTGPPNVQPLQLGMPTLRSLKRGPSPVSSCSHCSPTVARHSAARHRAKRRYRRQRKDS